MLTLIHADMFCVRCHYLSGSVKSFKIFKKLHCVFKRAFEPLKLHNQFWVNLKNNTSEMSGSYFVLMVLKIDLIIYAKYDTDMSL